MLVLSGCGTGIATTVTRNDSAATPRPNLPAAKLAVTPADAAHDVPLDSKLVIAATGGTINQIAVTENGAPVQLPGELSADGSQWILNGGLDSNAAYALTAVAMNANGQATKLTSAFHTLNATNQLNYWVYPWDGETVGVGMPIKFHFDSPIPDAQKQGILDHIAIQSSPAQSGGWYWLTDYEVHYRPVHFWTSGTTVHVLANLNGVNAGNGVWGVGNYSTGFTVGEKHVSIVDTASHQMYVYTNDQLQYQWPVSTGRPNLQTINGTLVVWGKIQDVLMDSLGLGIPRNSPDGYYEHVYWDTSISTDGFYIHSAPWSVWAQGRQNVSHGCVNLSPARAITFFYYSNPGDVVIVQNSTRPASFDDGEGDWQVPQGGLIVGGTAVMATSPLYLNNPHLQ